MKILVINPFGKCVIVNASCIPQIGAKVDLFYTPVPKVKEVVMWPQQGFLKELNCAEHEIEAIVFVE